MSEFTNGVLFLNNHLIEMKQFASILDTEIFTAEFIENWYQNNAFASSVWKQQFDNRRHLDYLIHEVNKKWSILLIEDWVFSLQNQSIFNWLQNMSNEYPFLVFNYGEDHGWSYHLFNFGEIISTINISYELEWHLVYEILEVKYPHLVGDLNKLLDVEDVRPLYEKVPQSEAYHQAVDNMYRDHIAEKFTAFGISTKDISRLKSAISTEQYKKSHESMLSQVDSFRAILGFEEVTWMSYRYLKQQQDESE